MFLIEMLDSNFYLHFVNVLKYRVTYDYILEVGAVLNNVDLV